MEDIVNKTKEESEASCDLCDKKCINDQGLALHKSRMHDVKKKVMDLIYKCDQCEGKFQMKELLTRHITKFHKTEKVKVECESIKRVHSTSPSGGKKKTKIEKEKTEVEKMQEELQRYKKESEKKYNELKEENLKMKEVIEKLEIEKAIALSKQEVDVNIKKTKKSTERQEIAGEKVSITKEDMSECIDRLSSMNLIQMKNMGGQRTSPAEQASQRPLFPCHLCEFGSDSQNVWDKHLKDKHRNVFNCPLCNNTFSDLNVLKNHIYSHHKEGNRQENRKQKTKPCAFFNQERGCKKKDECDFSHEQLANDQVNKVPKVCWNGPRCRWKPRCRYVHPEDGEVIPPREERLGFGGVDRSLPPPVYAGSSGRQSQSQRSQRGAPNINNMGEFPGMAKPRHMMEIWV